MALFRRLCVCNGCNYSKHLNYPPPLTIPSLPERPRYIILPGPLTTSWSYSLMFFVSNVLLFLVLKSSARPLNSPFQFPLEITTYCENCKTTQRICSLQTMNTLTVARKTMWLHYATWYNQYRIVIAVLDVGENVKM